MEWSLEQRVAHIVSTCLSPVLRLAGFKKTAGIYRAAQDKLAKIVDVQRSRWNHDPQREFTINGGICVPGVVSVYLGLQEPSKPRIKDCCLSVRIGMLDNAMLDKWWQVSVEDDPH